MISFKSLEEKFYSKYSFNNESLQLFFAPGRVNIIGEHIDYNGGPVLPAGISLGIYVIARKRNDSSIHLKSDIHLKESVVNINDPFYFNDTDEWTNYPKGIFQYLKDQHFILGGLDILVVSDLPSAAGLSSSAALELVFAYTILNVYNPNSKISLIELALLCQKVENKYIGVQCGIMDQFASALAKKNHAIFLACNSLQYEYVFMNLQEYSLVIMNTNKKRSLSTSAFNTRREECELALKIINETNHYDSLCDAKIEDIELIKNSLIYKRAKHVITEKNRVIELKNSFEMGLLLNVGLILNQSHFSLQYDFEVSCFELDTLVALAQQNPYCIGARMTGAGFGGCAIALVKTELFHDFKEDVAKQYKIDCNLAADFYLCEISDGVRELYIN